MANFEKIDSKETLKAKGAEFEGGLANTLIAQNQAAKFIVKGFSLQRLQTRFFKVSDQNEDKQIEQTTNETPEASFGLSVFTNLEFKAGSFQTLNGEVISFSGLRLDTVLMTVSMSKNIVKTAIQGRNGTVKEYIADGDFEVDVKGVLVGNGQNVYPSTEVELLTSLLTVQGSLKVTSEFLDRFGSITPKGPAGITDVVIEDFSFAQQEGFRNIQLFSFRMVSDTPIELTF